MHTLQNLLYYVMMEKANNTAPTKIVRRTPMKRNLQSEFQPRQYMLSKDYEIFYYSDRNLGHVVDWHTHDYYEFYFFLEGNVDIQVDDQSYAVHNGDFIIIPPKLRHRPLIHDQKVSYRRFVFWISTDYYTHLKELCDDYTYLIDYAGENHMYRFSTNQITYNEVQSKLLRILEELQSKQFGWQAQVPLYVNDLILHLSRLVYTDTHPQSRSMENALYQKIALYIEEHLDEDLSLDTLAQKFYVSRYHIAHVFKDKLGMSIHQYITKKRLARCRQAILGPSTITEIYETYGFGDYSSFYRAFKKEYGISPKDYRDMQQVDIES